MQVVFLFLLPLFACLPENTVYSFFYLELSAPFSVGTRSCLGFFVLMTMVQAVITFFFGDE